MAGEATKPFWHRSTFLIVTGASQGIGKNLAIEFSRLVDPKSTILLIARSLPNLEDTKKKILKINSALDVKVNTFKIFKRIFSCKLFYRIFNCNHSQVQSVDLSKPDSQLYRNLLQSAAAKNRYELYLLVHNAASMIVDIPASKMEDTQLIEK